MRSGFPLLLLLAACQSTPSAAPPPDPVGEEVRTMLRQMYADLSARKWDILENHFIAGATITFPRKNGSVLVLPIKEFLEKDKKQLEGKKEFGEKMISAEVRVHQRTAQAWSRFEGNVDGDTWTGIDAMTLIKGADGWKIVTITVSVDPKP